MYCSAASSYNLNHTHAHCVEYEYGVDEVLKARAGGYAGNKDTAPSPWCPDTPTTLYMVATHDSTYALAMVLDHYVALSR